MRLKAWLFSVHSIVVSMQLPCVIRSCWDVSENEAGWVHWRVWWQALTSIVGAGCNKGKSWRLKNTFFLIWVPLWRTTVLRQEDAGGGAGRAPQHLKAKLAHYVSNTPPCPYSIDQRLPKKPPKEAESYKFKEEKTPQSEGQGGKNVKFQSFHPPS